MPFIIEIGVRSGRLSVVFKYGRPDATTCKVSLLAAPRHIVALLALCQCWTILTALVHQMGIWFIYGALLVAVVCYLRRTMSIVECGPSASLFVNSRRGPPKGSLFTPKSASQMVRDRCTKFLKNILLAVDAENNIEVYHQVRI